MVNYYIPLVATPQIGEGGGGGGSDLPSVTAADNGDVLTVVNGAWDKAAPSGGGVLVVNVTEDGSGNAVCDKTAGEMWAALNSGVVVFNHSLYGYPQREVCTSCDNDEGYYFISDATFNVQGFGMLSAPSASDYPQVTSGE